MVIFDHACCFVVHCAGGNDPKPCSHTDGLRCILPPTRAAQSACASCWRSAPTRSPKNGRHAVGAFSPHSALSIFLRLLFPRFFSRSDFRFCFFWLAGANSSRIALLNFESWRRCENSSQDERTALMAAAFRGHADCVRLLLDAGANGLAKDKVCVRLYVCACVCACVVFVCKCAM